MHKLSIFDIILYRIILFIIFLLMQHFITLHHYLLEYIFEKYNLLFITLIKKLLGEVVA